MSIAAELSKSYAMFSLFFFLVCVLKHMNEKYVLYTQLFYDL